ncbi:beta-ketoacyl-ACP synthase III [Streptomyces cinerochromogenes]|uniref:beta-ketoacyl-ACP synthase III n=1 Tax=Streptomyces cinerochromogenes TaxID=66422 RepID=UPI0033A1988C
MTASRITSTAYYQPAKVLTNGDLKAIVDTSDEWIRSRVGIQTRHVIDTETVADLAVAAGGKALASAGLDPGSVDLVVAATSTVEDRSPNLANRVAAELGLAGPAAMEVSTACSGFNHALAVADQAIRAGRARRALVVAADAMSRIADWTDRTTCVLVGDGAGAVTLEACPEADWGVGPVHWGSVPEKSRAVLIEGAPLRFSQEGQTVYRWATTRLAALARETCAAAGVELDRITAFVPHQANLRIVEPLARQLGFTGKVVSRDVVESGNTGAASVALGFAKLIDQGELHSGDFALLFGFGGGLAYAGQVVRCP